MLSVRHWANEQAQRWCFTTLNAAASYTEHYSDPNRMDQINWDAVQERYWTDPEVKEAKQAEFLVERNVPWHLVNRIGVQNQATAHQVNNVLPTNGHRPTVQIMPTWYY